MKYYYINLDRHTERKQNMELFFKNLSKCMDEKIDYKRISGFDANNIEDLNKFVHNGNFEDMQSIYVPQRILKYQEKLLLEIKNLNITKKKTNLKKGEFGCLYSHLQALNDFINTNDDIAMICEDDLSSEIVHNNKYIYKIINELSSNIDNYGIISLSVVGPIDSVKFAIENNIKLTKYSPNRYYGTACYIIEKNTAKKIILNSVRFIDNIMKIKFYYNRSYVADILLYSFSNTHIFIPSLFFTNEMFGSSIDNDTLKHKIVQDIMLKSLGYNIVEKITDNDHIEDKKVNNLVITKKKNKGKKLSNNQLLKYLSK